MVDRGSQRAPYAYYEFNHESYAYLSKPTYEAVRYVVFE